MGDAELVQKRQGAAQVLERLELGRQILDGRRQERRAFHGFGDEHAAAVPLRQEAKVQDAGEMRLIARRIFGLRLGEPDGVAEEVRRGHVGHAGLPRHLDQHRSDERAAKELIGLEDHAVGAAQADLLQAVLTVQHLAQHGFFKRRGHDSGPTAIPRHRPAVAVGHHPVKLPRVALEHQRVESQ